MNNLESLDPIRNIQEIPVPYQRRSCTDVLCIPIAALFSLTLLLAAYLMSDYGNYYRSNFPADSEGRLCGIDAAAQLYPYLYFVEAPRMARRVCVKKCPAAGDKSLQCLPTASIGCRFNSQKGFEVSYYPNAGEESRSGLFCLPHDQGLREQLLDNANLKQREELYNQLDLLKLCFGVTVGFSVLYMLAVQLFPRAINYAVVGLGCAIMLGSAICIGTYSTQHIWLKALAIVALTLLVAVIVITSIKSYSSWRMHAIFLSFATAMVSQRKSTLAYIVIFQVLLCIFVVLSYLQFAIIGASGQLAFEAQQSVFHQPRGSNLIVFYVLLFVQTVWGFSFIKSAANFCVAGQAVLWQSRQDLGFFYPFKLIATKHLGSIIASAFMNGFVSIFDFLFDTVKLVAKLDDLSCCPCLQVLELVREDAAAYINLTGNPYCNSSRYCEYLCRRSQLLDYSQSTSRVYRISAHTFITGAILILALYVRGHISLFSLSIVGLMALFTCTTFVSFHADISEAIQIILLSKEEFARDDASPGGASNLSEYLGKMEVEPHLAQEIAKQRTEQLTKNNDANLTIN